MLLQYRAAALAGLVTQVFWGLIRMMVLIAFYESTTQPQPMGLERVISYVWLGQAFLLLVISGGDAEVAQLIRGGNIAYELLRPIDLYNLWYCRMLASRLAPVLLRAAPMLVLASIIGWVHWPGWPNALAALASFAAAFLLSSAIGALMTLTMLWTVSGIGINRLLGAMAYFLSGIVVPLPLLPEGWQGVVQALPFRGLGDVPYRFFTGDLGVAQLPLELAHQLGWTIALVVLGRAVLAKAVRRVVVQGG
jgi:ABC-2 type transport system permease protein